MRDLRLYSSYRDFLKDAFFKEKQHTGVSMAVYAKALGMSAPLFQMILSGKRDLTVANIHNIAQKLRLSTPDHEYFEALVQRDQSEDDEQKSFYARRLLKIGKTNRSKNVRVSDHGMLASPLLPALLIYLIDIQKGQAKEFRSSWYDESVNALARKFCLSPAQIRSALSLFERHGLLEYDREDHVHVVFERVTRQLAKKEFMRKVAEEAVLHVEKGFDKPDSNYFRSFTLSISQRGFRELCLEINSLFEKYMARVEPKEELKIIQSFVSIVPLIAD